MRIGGFYYSYSIHCILLDFFSLSEGKLFVWSLQEEKSVTSLEVLVIT